MKRSENSGGLHRRQTEIDELKEEGKYIAKSGGEWGDREEEKWFFTEKGALADLSAVGRASSLSFVMSVTSTLSPFFIILLSV